MACVVNCCGGHASLTEIVNLQNILRLRTVTAVCIELHLKRAAAACKLFKLLCFKNKSGVMRLPMTQLNIHIGMQYK